MNPEYSILSVKFGELWGRCLMLNKCMQFPLCLESLFPFYKNGIKHMHTCTDNTNTHMHLFVKETGSMVAVDLI